MPRSFQTSDCGGETEARLRRTFATRKAFQSGSCASAGRNLTSAHSGIIKLHAGQMEIREGRPVGGEFTLDMDSIENLDLQDSEMRQILIRHLKSDDFFDVGRFPTAEFRFSKITPLPGARRGSPN